jgi:prevent-host-death family protein
MRPIQVAEDIVPIAEFKARASEVVRRIRETGRPVVITQNGKPAAVVVSPEDFDSFSYQERFRAAVREGLADADAGRVVSDEELGRILNERFGTVGEP